MSGFIGDKFPSVLGGGIPGRSPALLSGGGGNSGRYSTSGMEGGAGRAISREFLRRAFGNRPALIENKGLTPFRRLFSAGDPANTVNSAPSPLLGRPINAVSGNAMVSRLHARSGGVQAGQALFSGNPKYVYDSSTYVRFKHLVAKNKTYNDLSFGGDDHSAVQSALRRVRRG
jgi:hypothetical protein